MLACGAASLHAEQSQTFAWVADTRGDENAVVIDKDVLHPIMNSILALDPAPQVVIFGGDAAYRGGTANLTDFMTEFTDRLDAKGIPSAFAVGNHELYTMHHAPNLADEALSRQQDFQALFNGGWTQNGPAGFTNLAFSFHMGNSLFIIADSYYATADGSEPAYGINAAQQDWMKGLLKDNTAAHTFVFTHIPAYSPFMPSTEQNMEDTWRTITTSGDAENANASILFAGHQHLYYRTLRDGTYEVLAGTGGAPLGCEDDPTCKPAPVEPGDVVVDDRYNYAVVSIEGREVTVTVLDQFNRSIDRFQYFDVSGVSHAAIVNAAAIAPDPLEQRPTGILAASDNAITNLSSISNVLTGIDAVDDNTIVNSGVIAPMSGGNGIHVYDRNTITNTAAGSITGDSKGLWGIRVNTGNTVENRGVVAVSGTNSIAFLAQGDGNTFINRGTLRASGTDSYAVKFLGTGNAFVNSGVVSGSLWFGAGDNEFTNNGIFNGPGDLYKTGPGALTVRGAASYTGGTYLGGGIVDITQDASLGALASGLYFDGGTLRMSAAVASARSVVLGAGGGTLDAHGQASVFSGVFADGAAVHGVLTIADSVGGGRIVLSGTDNSYTGGTVVNSGTLQVGADDALPTVGALAVYSGGAFDTAGCVQTVGSYSGAGILRVTLQPGANSFHVTNNADLTGGTLAVNLTPQIVHSGDIFIPILYGGRTGTFASIVSPAALSFAPTYDDVSKKVVLTTILVPFVDSAAGDNQAAVANALEPLRGNPTGDAATVLGNLYTLYAPQLRAAFDQIGPVALGSMSGIGMAAAGAQSAALGQRLTALADGSVERGSFASYTVSGTSPYPGTLLAYAGQDISGLGLGGTATDEDADSPWGYYTAGVFTTGRLSEAESGSGTQPGYAFTTAGLTFGADYRLDDHLAAGALAGYLHGYASISSPGSGLVEDDSARLGVYGTGSVENLHASLYLGGALDFYKTRRGIIFGQISRTAEAAPLGKELNTSASASYDIQALAGGTVSPFAGLDYNRLMIGGFMESGADTLNLDVAPQTSQSLKSSLGLRFAKLFADGPRSWKPYLSLGWRHEFEDQGRPIDASLAIGGGSQFSVRTGDFAHDGTLVGAGFLLSWTKQTTAKLVYSGDYRSNFQEHSVEAALHHKF